MRLFNPYHAFFLALPPSVRRDPATTPTAAELLSPDWLAFKAAVAGHFAWAVPTDEAIAAIRRHAPSVVEIGAGGGYWAWLLRQAGVTVAAFDVAPPPFTWSEVRVGDAAAAGDHADKALFLCWPPWGAGMATRALAAHGGRQVIYVGEWLGGAADPAFFAALAAQFTCVEVVAIPQWFMRDDRLMVFERR
ncbi:hypothetical protein [Phenylobacterium sp.]|uniref:hypothetical protein n=1 Tax=Phenylobacterium sp. TaxID=1871053 RepID=UPI0025EA73B3|nr:hypothetical protein [Phenylobacterium sp.]